MIVEEEVPGGGADDAASIEDLRKQLEGLKAIKKKVIKAQKSDNTDLDKLQ